MLTFNAALDRVNQKGIFFKFCSMVIGDPVLSVLIHCLSIRGAVSVSRECFDPSIVLPIHRVDFLHTREQPYGNADDFTLVAVVPSPGERVQ